MIQGATLKGSISGSALVEILQMVANNRTSGLFQCTEGPHKLQVYFNSAGAIIHAVSTSRAVGLDALEELAVWHDGSYTFTEAPVTVAPTINKPSFQLLTSLAAKIDEWKVLQRAIPSIYLFPYPAVLPGEQVDFSAREAKILEWCNGHYTVEELAMAVGQPITAIAKILYGLILNDYIELKAVRYPHPPAPALQTRPVAPAARPALVVAPASSSVGVPDAFDPAAILKAASEAPPSAVPAPEASPSVVTDYLLYASRIFETATQHLPESLGNEIAQLFDGCKAAIMFDGAANLQTLKALALDINRMANARMAEGQCAREAIIAYNEEVKRLFGILKS